MYRRPRHDLEASYFVVSYRRETEILTAHADIVRTAMTRFIARERVFHDAAASSAGKRPRGGLAPLPREQTVLLHSSHGRPDSVLPDNPCKVALFEFHPGIGEVSDLHCTLQAVLAETSRVLVPQTSSELQRLDLKLLEIAKERWERIADDNIDRLGMSEQASAIFAPEVADNPASMAAIAARLAAEAPPDEGGGKKGECENSKCGDAIPNLAAPTASVAALRVYSHALELVTLRHRIIMAFHETLNLTAAYIHRSRMLGLEETVAWARPFPLSRAGGPAGFEGGDFFIPSRHPLAVHEFEDAADDDGSVSFTSPVKVQQLLARSSGIHDAMAERAGTATSDTLRGVLQVQVAVRNATMVAVEFFEISEDPNFENTSDIRQLIDDDPECDVLKVVQARTAFLSLQSIKSSARQKMHAEYLKRRPSGVPAPALVNEMLGVLSAELSVAIETPSLRTQMARYLKNLKGILGFFPSTRDYYFKVGEPNQQAKQKVIVSAADEAVNDESVKGPTSILKKTTASLAAAEEKKVTQKLSALQTLSDDGTKLLNLWYLPHTQEITDLYESLDAAARRQALRRVLHLTFVIHDITMVLCAHARLGSSHARLGTQDVAFIGVGADWGGTEGIGAELRQLRRNLAKLADPEDLGQVSDFLERRRQCVYLEWYLATKYYVLETFLGKGNQKAFDTIVANTRSGLPALGSGRKAHFFGAPPHCSLPAKLKVKSGDAAAKTLFPWRATMDQHEEFTGGFLYADIGAYLELCLTNLTDVERHIANGEVLGISLMIEDIMEQEDLGDKRDSPGAVAELVERFLTVSIRLERLKLEWCARTLGINITSPQQYRTFLSAYEAQVSGPCVKQYLKTRKTNAAPDDSKESSRSAGRSTAGLLVGQGTALQLLGIPEMVYRVHLVDELQNIIECMMVNGSRAMLRAKKLTIASEQSQDAHELPSDVWAAESREGTTRKSERGFSALPAEISECSIVTEFSRELQRILRPIGGSNQSSAGGGCAPDLETAKDFVLSVSDLKRVINALGVAVLSREKDAYLAYARQNAAIEGHLLNQLQHREFEVAAIDRDFKAYREEEGHRTRCYLADRSRDLIAEITAARAKISRMREEQETQDHDSRERVKRDYDELVHSLFSTSFALKNRFEEYRSKLYDDVVDGLCEVRKAALHRLKLIAVGKTEEADNKYNRGIARADNLRDVQSENSQLSGIVLKMRTMNDWKRTGLQSFYGKKIFQAKSEAALFKRALLEEKLGAEEDRLQSDLEVMSLRQELSSLQCKMKETQINLQEERRKRLALQKWKTLKSQLLAGLEDQTKVFEKIKHLDIDAVLSTMESHAHDVAASERAAADVERSHELAVARLKAEARQLRKQLADESQIKNKALERIEFLERQLFQGEVDGNSRFSPVSSSGISRPASARSPTARPGSGRIREGSRPGSASPSRSRPSSARSPGGMYGQHLRDGPTPSPSGRGQPGLSPTGPRLKRGNRPGSATQARSSDAFEVGIPSVNGEIPPPHTHTHSLSTQNYLNGIYNYAVILFLHDLPRSL